MVKIIEALTPYFAVIGVLATIRFLSVSYRDWRDRQDDDE